MNAPTETYYARHLQFHYGYRCRLIAELETSIARYQSSPGAGLPATQHRIDFLISVLHYATQP